MPRIHVPGPLVAGQALLLPAAAARHVQVLRLQPGDPVILFTGEGGEWSASVARMGRSDVEVLVGKFIDLERESSRAVHVAVGMPANDRMDWLIEKATELGVASVTPLVTAHGVLRLAGERAVKKQSHWQAVAMAAAEQCGRNRVPFIAEPLPFATWLASRSDEQGSSVLMAPDAKMPLAAAAPSGQPVCVLIGPEGGLSPTEIEAALAAGFAAASLGPRVLRTDTAVLAALAVLA